MTYGWALLILFLVGYASIFGAVLWHLNIYSFSRSARIISVAFVFAAVMLAVLALVFFSHIEWSVFGNLLEVKKTI